MDKKN